MIQFITTCHLIITMSFLFIAWLPSDSHTEDQRVRSLPPPTPSPTPYLLPHLIDLLAASPIKPSLPVKPQHVYRCAIIPSAVPHDSAFYFPAVELGSAKRRRNRPVGWRSSGLCAHYMNTAPPLSTLKWLCGKSKGVFNKKFLRVLNRLTLRHCCNLVEVLLRLPLSSYTVKKKNLMDVSALEKKAAGWSGSACPSVALDTHVSHNMQKRKSDTHDTAATPNCVSVHRPAVSPKLYYWPKCCFSFVWSALAKM